MLGNGGVSDRCGSNVLIFCLSLSAHFQGHGRVINSTDIVVPLSPLQEHYSEDSYQLLSCCILCSRTSGGETVMGAVRAFFEACPTPSRVLSKDEGELRDILLPLGLNRCGSRSIFA